MPNDAETPGGLGTLVLAADHSVSTCLNSVYTYYHVKLSEMKIAKILVGQFFFALQKIYKRVQSFKNITLEFKLV
jgi:hypothetical protein